MFDPWLNAAGFFYALTKKLSAKIKAPPIAYFL